jgi:hypothetical protein
MKKREDRIQAWHWVYDETGQCRGRCRACDVIQRGRGDEPVPAHHALCPRREVEA